MKQKRHCHLGVDFQTIELIDLYDTIWSLLEEGVHKISSAFIHRHSPP